MITPAKPPSTGGCWSHTESLWVCKCQDLQENWKGWCKEVKKAKLPHSHMDGQILAMLSPSAESHTCNQEMPLVKETGTIYGPNYNDRQANMQQGDNKWPQYFFTEQTRGRQNAPAPVLGGLFNLPSPLRQQPRIVSSCNSCSCGGRRSTETHSCAPTIAGYACWASLDPSPWVQRWDQLPRPLPKPQSLWAVQDNLQVFFFHASTLSVWRIKDTATPHKLSLQSIFCILSITYKYVSPWPAHQFHEMVSAHAALDLYPQLVNRDDAFGKFSCHEALRAVC